MRLLLPASILLALSACKPAETDTDGPADTDPVDTDAIDTDDTDPVDTDDTDPVDTDDTDPPFVPALVNGHFEDGLEGWTQEGDGQFFRQFQDSGYDDVWSLTTYTVTGERIENAAIGAIYQTFTVPDDVFALRFVVFGGKGRVVLLDDAGEVLEEASGPSVNGARVPVSWNLAPRRGDTLTLRIEDDSADGWGFVSVSGFDVLRVGEGPLLNGSFEEGFDGWVLADDAADFLQFQDPVSGGRAAVSTWNEIEENGATGSVYQDFVVPDDALALRFVVYGGIGVVRLSDQGTVVAEVSGPSDNDVRVPVSFDLVAMRGRALRIAIEDRKTGSWGFISSTGFDVITEENGP